MNKFQKLNNTKETDEEFQILRIINKKPNSTQRQLANELGFSLGKLNYCLRALKEKGLVKIDNFKKKSIQILLYLCFDTSRNSKKNKINS